VTAGGQWRKGRERERKGKLEKPIRNLKNSSKLEKSTRNSKLEKSTRNSKNPLETRKINSKLEKLHSKLEKPTRNSKNPLETYTLTAWRRHSPGFAAVGARNYMRII
jgi:hypothetical protein